MAKKGQWKKQHVNEPAAATTKPEDQQPVAEGGKETAPAEPAYQLNTPYAGC